jgi:hypothetical protein
MVESDLASRCGFAAILGLLLGALCWSSQEIVGLGNAVSKSGAPVPTVVVVVAVVWECQAQRQQQGSVF